MQQAMQGSFFYQVEMEFLRVLCIDLAKMVRCR